MQTYPTRDPSDVSGAKSLDICTDGSLYGSQYVFSCAVGGVSAIPPTALGPVWQNPLILLAIHAEIINLWHNGMFMYKCNNQLLSLSPHIMIEKMKKSGKWREEQEKRGNIDDICESRGRVSDDIGKLAVEL